MNGLGAGLCGLEGTPTDADGTLVAVPAGGGAGAEDDGTGKGGIATPEEGAGGGASELPTGGGATEPTGGGAS